MQSTRLVTMAKASSICLRLTRKTPPVEKEKKEWRANVESLKEKMLNKLNLPL